MTNPFSHLVHVNAPSPCILDPGVTTAGIKIGVIATLTGPDAASFSDSVTGLRARVDEANKSRELGRRSITLVVRNDGGDPIENLRQARELVDQAKVWLIVEVSSSSGGSASYLNQHMIPVTGWQAGSPAWGIDTNMFTFRLPTAADPAHVYNNRDATIMRNARVTKVAIIGSADRQSVALLARNKAALKSVGIQVVYDNETVPAARTAFPTEVQKVKDSGADALLTALTLPAAIKLSEELRKAGVALKEVQFPSGYDPRLLSRFGMQGAFFGLEFKPFESNPPAYQAFNDFMPSGAIRDEVSYIGWLAGEITLQGIKDAGISCPTRTAFVANLRLEHAYTGRGAFDPVDLEGGFGSEFACAYYVKVVNAHFVPQFGGVEQCGQPVHF